MASLALMLNRFANSCFSSIDLRLKITCNVFSECSISLFNIFTSTISPFLVIIPSLITLFVTDVDLPLAPRPPVGVNPSSL